MLVLLILEWAVIIRCFLSWIPLSPRNKFVLLIYNITEPIVAPFRKIRLGGPGMMVDFSPFFAVLALYLIRSLILPQIFIAMARLF
ncbi:YggT family protein [Dehalobacter sp. DCM]|uniref:YggT family protein n=1 Tax=Dehalobacter sp. DCM TaxID=2907827 RepID=UPI003081DC15|nr:YggT family protein [Dehalobacter sp. DCM]